MNLYDRRTVRLLDVAEVERAKAGKTYPAGSILIQVSATQGQMRLLSEPREVEAKHAVIQLTAPDIYPPYLFFVLDMVMPHFLARYQTTINIQVDVFKHLEFEVHNEPETQREIVEAFAKLDERIADEQRAIDRLKDFKAWHLDTMFA